MKSKKTKLMQTESGFVAARGWREEEVGGGGQRVQTSIIR